MWFLEPGVEKIGRIDGRPPYHLEEFYVPASLDGSRDLAVGRDGALWFTESRKIARVDQRPPHAVTEFAVPSGRDPVSLAVDADDGIWFTTAFSGFGRIRPGTPREVEEFDLAAADAGFSRIVYGRDGNLWFATHKNNRLIRVQREYPHTVTEIPLRVPGSVVTDLAFRSAGDLWFVAGAGNYVGHMWPSEPFELDMYPLDSPPSTPQRLVFGSDGMLWLTDPDRNRILRLVVPEPGAEFQSARARIGTAAERGIKWYTPNRPSPAKGSIGIRTDAEVVLFVDSERLTQLRANSNEIFPLPVGTHIVSALGVSTGRSWGKAVEVVVGQHVQMRIEGLGVLETKADSFAPALPRFRFVPVPSGEFFMGSDVGSADEVPRHRVRMTRSSEMSRCEVTQDEWTLVMGKNPSAFEFRGGDLPVVNVSWDDTEEFCRRLETLDPTHRYRLPTEAEWEYACRAGASADPANLEEYAWFGDKAFFTTHPVGTKRPNDWGLHDMYGNVAEWCRDWYDRFYYRRSIDVDPPGPSNGSDRVVRGGDYRMRANAFRATERRAWPPTTRANGLGFRLVRSVP